MARLLCLVALIAALCVPTAVQSKTGVDRGIAYLGSFTFYRVVDGTRSVLVRFDKKHYWHTGFDTAFEELAERVAMSHLVNSSQMDCDDFLVGNLPVSKQQHEVDNIVIAKRYNISEADLPTLRLFVKGTDPKTQPLEIPADVSQNSAAQMMRWIEKTTGVFCGLIGQLKDLHVIAQKLLQGGEPEDMLVLAKAAVAKMEPQDQAMAKNYMEAFEKATKDRDWPYNEYQRLKAKMPRWSPHVPPDDLRDAEHQRLHALSSFIDPVEDEKAESKEEL